MKSRLTSLIDVRSGEGRLVVLMLLYYYLVLLTYYFLKPARDSLFLVRLGADQLPIVFILTAAVIAPITTLYASAGRRLKLVQLIAATSVVSAVCLALLRLLVGIEAGWVYYVFYVWVSVFGALTASQFWLFANAVFTPTQARRIFPMLGMAGILGAITGGEVTRLVVRTFGARTEDLLWASAAMVIILAGIAALAAREYVRAGRPRSSRRSRTDDRGDTFVQLVAMIRRSKHLSYLVGIIAVSVAASTFVDYQFKTMSVAAHPVEQDLTAFFGAFYSRVSMLSLFVQVALGYRLVQRLGVGGVVMFLPMSLVLGGVSMLIFPGLFAAAALRGADGVFKYSLDRTGRELLFVPLPLQVKKRTKVFIDMFVDRFARGVSGAVLLVLVAAGVPLFGAGVALLLLLAVWLYLLVRVRREYVESFRIAIARRAIDPTQMSMHVNDAVGRAVIRDVLRGGNEREVSYALDLIADSPPSALLEELAPLVGHPASDIRRRALELVAQLDGDIPDRAYQLLLRDPDVDVRFAAMRLMCARAGVGSRALLVAYLSGDDASLAASALRCAAVAGERAAVEAAALTGLIGRLTANDDPLVRREVARALGALADPLFDAALITMAGDRDERVAAAAIGAMAATRSESFIGPLLGALSGRRLRQPARVALAAFGDRAVAAIEAALDDETIPVRDRLLMVAVMSRIPTAVAVDTMIRMLDNTDARVRYRAIRTLNKLRARHSDLDVPGPGVDAAFIEEAARYAKTHAALQAGGPDAGPAAALLQRALHDALDRHLEHAFRLLALRYRSDDVYSAYLALTGSARDRRENAGEFLENLVAPRLRRHLWPMIETRFAGPSPGTGGGQSASRSAQALATLMESRDPWLRACAVYAAAHVAPLHARVVRAVDDSDAIVSETAKLVLRSA